MSARARSLILIAGAQVLALSAWFASSAALPGMIASGAVSAAESAALTSLVQVGFVAGALTSAWLMLSDRFDARRVFAIGALGAGVSSLISSGAEPGSEVMLASRFAAGASLALVYPVGMKLAASWARNDAGLLVGLLVGALTLGSAAPHLVPGLMGDIDWRAPFIASGAAAVLAGIIILASEPGPAFKPARRFDPSAIFTLFRRPHLREINLGYLGHMWELYAFWAWLGAFLVAWREARGGQPELEIGFLTFAVIAIGAVGALGAGWLADRFGRTLVTSAAMALSGACALLTAWVWAGPGWAMIVLLLMYGVVVIADSAQFSAGLAEMAPADQAGSLLTLQTALGFALTVVTVQALPYWAELVGWRYAFLPLAVGPFLGVWAMLRLRGRPEAAAMASGRR
ncbi:MAG: MFS transporter [Pseudomonadota bacterium]